MARRVLHRNSTIREFVMAMGHAFFIDKDGENVDIDGSRETMKPLAYLLDEWDDVFHLTGDPMWIKDEGPVVTEW